MTVYLAAPLVHETSLVTGTGPITLEGAVALNNSFGTIYSNGAPVVVVVRDNVNWEILRCTYNQANNRLDVVSTLRTLGGGTTKLDWPAGSKDVFPVLWSPDIRPDDQAGTLLRAPGEVAIENGVNSAQLQVDGQGDLAIIVGGVVFATFDRGGDIFLEKQVRSKGGVQLRATGNSEAVELLCASSGNLHILTDDILRTTISKNTGYFLHYGSGNFNGNLGVDGVLDAGQLRVANSTWRRAWRAYSGTLQGWTEQGGFSLVVNAPDSRTDPPASFGIRLNCVTAEYGYSIGDAVDIIADPGLVLAAQTVGTTTTIRGRGRPSLVFKSTPGQSLPVTPARWHLTAFAAWHN